MDTVADCNSTGRPKRPRAPSTSCAIIISHVDHVMLASVPRVADSPSDEDRISGVQHRPGNPTPLRLPCHLIDGGFRRRSASRSNAAVSAIARPPAIRTSASRPSDVPSGSPASQHTVAQRAQTARTSPGIATSTRRPSVGVKKVRHHVNGRHRANGSDPLSVSRGGEGGTPEHGNDPNNLVGTNCITAGLQAFAALASDTRPATHAARSVTSPPTSIRRRLPNSDQTTSASIATSRSWTAKRGRAVATASRAASVA